MSKPHHWFLLFKLAGLGALTRDIFTSTTALAKEFSCSQQTASRWLKELSMQGYIERKINLRGEYIVLTAKGKCELTNMHSALTMLLKPRATPYIEVEGKLFTGFGEGAYYITRGGYINQFLDKLGFKPYPGTLNLKLTTPDSLALRKEIENLPAIMIEGFSNDSRTYGMLKCLPAVINDKVKGAVLFIQRTHYDSSVLEVIAPVNFRKTLKLKDGDLVRVRVKVSST